MTKELTLVSWNVNGIRAAQQKGFIDWIDNVKPDVLCIQETKANKEQLDANLLNPAGYTSYFNSAEKKGYSGTAIYCQNPPLECTALGVPEFDAEGRAQIADFGQFVLMNAYYPNSQPERARLDYKLRFVDAMITKADSFVKQGRQVVLCGDFNIAHKPIDLKNPKTNEDNAGYYIEERQAMDKFLAAGYVDTFRQFNQSPDQYSWWSYRMNARVRNIGWRIDYFLVNNGSAKNVTNAFIWPEVMGSDHCPVGIKLIP